jgi:hypothetical protein
LPRKARQIIVTSGFVKQSVSGFSSVKGFPAGNTKPSPVAVFTGSVGNFTDEAIGSKDELAVASYKYPNI